MAEGRVSTSSTQSLKLRNTLLHEEEGSKEQDWFTSLHTNPATLPHMGLSCPFSSFGGCTEDAQGFFLALYLDNTPDVLVGLWS